MAGFVVHFELRLDQFLFSVSPESRGENVGRVKKGRAGVQFGSRNNENLLRNRRS